MKPVYTMTIILIKFWLVKLDSSPTLNINDLGCWKDTVKHAILDQDSYLGGDYRMRTDAVKKCAEFAHGKEYDVFAVQDGGKCFTDPHARVLFRKYGPSGLCSSDGKGGTFANQVYEINAKHNYDYTYHGCYKDENTRAIATVEKRFVNLWDNYRTRTNEVEKCAHIAASLGYQMFAVQYGGWCATAPDAHETYDKYGATDVCESDGQGGPWGNAVYNIVILQMTTRKFTTAMDLTANPTYSVPALDLTKMSSSNEGASDNSTSPRPDNSSSEHRITTDDDGQPHNIWLPILLSILALLLIGVVLFLLLRRKKLMKKLFISSTRSKDNSITNSNPHQAAQETVDVLANAATAPGLCEDNAYYSVLKEQQISGHNGLEFDPRNSVGEDYSYIGQYPAQERSNGCKSNEESDLNVKAEVHNILYGGYFKEEVENVLYGSSNAS